jgi:hypothetical protein
MPLCATGVVVPQWAKSLFDYLSSTVVLPPQWNMGL